MPVSYIMLLYYRKMHLSKCILGGESLATHRILTCIFMILLEELKAHDSVGDSDKSNLLSQNFLGQLGYMHNTYC